MIHRGFRYRLAPTSEQEAQFYQFAGVCRLVYNLALEQRKTWGRRHKINFVTQCADLTRLRAAFDWIEAVSRSCQNQALRDLDKAFGAFFSGRAGFPCARRKGQDDAFRFSSQRVSTRRLNGRWSAVHLPKIGWVKFRDTRALRGRMLSATVSRDADGWYIAFACEIEHDAPSPLSEAVGIDRGVANALALSTGELIATPASLERIELAARKAQRVLARRKRGSKRRERQRRRVARLRGRQARIRADFNHRASRAIADRFGTVAIEALNVAGMTRSAAGTVAEPGRNVRAKAGLNRAILARGWGQFERFLAYKLAERGGRLVKVNPRNTSRTCPACGEIDAQSRESQAVFRCVACGHTDHADVNAAIEILRRGSTSLLRVEAGARARPMKREPSTCASTSETGGSSVAGGC